MCMVGLAVDRPDAIRQPLSTVSTRGMSAVGQKQTSRHVRVRSVISFKAGHSSARPLSASLGVMVRLNRRRKHTIDLALFRTSPCLFQLGEHSGQQFVLRPQQELDRAEALAIRCPLGVFLEGGVWRKGADGGHGCTLDLVADGLKPFTALLFAACAWTF